MRHIQARNNHGVALPTVLGLGIVLLLFMLGTANLVIPSLSKLSNERTNDVLRDLSEAAIDWAVAQENTTSGRAQMDASSQNSSETTTIPSSVFPSALSSVGYSGTVSISNVLPPTYSYLYSPNFSGSNIGSSISGFRVVTATVKNSSGTLRKNVRVILMPAYNVTNTTSTSTYTSMGLGQPQAIFNHAMFSPGAISASGNATTNSYNSAATSGRPSTFVNQYGDVGTNTTAGLSSNSLIGGNLTVTSPSSTVNTQVATGSGTVTGNVVANGTISSGITASGTETANAGQAQQQLTSVPSAPSSATNIGSLSLSGNSSIVLGNGYYTLNGRTYSVPGNGGNFVVSSISMAGNASISVDPTGGPVNVYVQGSGSNNGITFSGNGVGTTNGSYVASNFRVWYNGTGTVKFSGNGNMVGVVYAPNAPISMVGNGTVYGSVVGNTISMTGNGTFHYDQALMNNSSLMWTPPIVITSTTTTTVHADTFDHFQAVSWCEF